MSPKHLGKKPLRQSTTKRYTDKEVLQNTNKLLTVLGRDAEEGNGYAIAIIKEVFKSKEGIRPTTGEHQTRTRTVTTQRTPNHEVQEAIQHSS
ncbi:MAG TPA: hypothetical protein VH415_05780 [Nitrososphaeraceae archaeon]|jgi:hypothetical protein